MLSLSLDQMKSPAVSGANCSAGSPNPSSHLEQDKPTQLPFAEIANPANSVDPKQHPNLVLLCEYRHTQDSDSAPPLTKINLIKNPAPRMNRRLLLLFFAIFAFLANNSLAADSKSKSKEPPKDVEIFSGGRLPDRTFAEIEVYTDDITIPEEPSITRRFAKKAQAKQADALIVSPLVESGTELSPFQGFKRTYAYRAIAVRYTGPPGSAPRPIIPAPPSAGSNPERRQTTESPVLVSSGTGFFITEDGYLVTNEHVVRGASLVRILHHERLLDAKIVRVDPNNDLALLKVDAKVSALPLGASRAARLGDPVLTVGFPMPDLQGQEPKLTRGDISGLAGFQDNPARFQVSTPVQPGNSGGPLVDRKGNVVGVIVSVLRPTQDAIPQNVNYAVKSSYVKALLETVAQLSEGTLPKPSDVERPDREVIDQTVASTVQVLKFR